MEFKPQKEDGSAVAGMISRLKTAEYENYSQRLGRNCRQMGEWFHEFRDDQEKLLRWDETIGDEDED